MRYIVFYSLLITSLIFSHGCSRLYNAYENEEVIQPTHHEELFVFTVTEILDGESIKVHTTGKDFQVVLSGIEIPTPECIKKEKIERIESLILGKKVALESAANTDTGSEKTHTLTGTFELLATGENGLIQTDKTNILTDPVWFDYLWKEINVLCPSIVWIRIKSHH